MHVVTSDCTVNPATFEMQVQLGGLTIHSALDTQATISIISLGQIPTGVTINKNDVVLIKVASNEILVSMGSITAQIVLGGEKRVHTFHVLDTEAFHSVIGQDFLTFNKDIKYISTEEPHHFLVKNPDGTFTQLPLKPSNQPSVCLRVVHAKFDLPYERLNIMFGKSQREVYKLDTKAKALGFEKLGVDLNFEEVVELFASATNADFRLFCSTKPPQKNGWFYHWGLLGLCYANPLFSRLCQVLTKIALDKARVVLVTPDLDGVVWSTDDPRVAYWHRLLQRMTLSSFTLPDVDIYLPDHADLPMPKPKWRTKMSLVDGALNPIAPLELFNLGESLPPHPHLKDNPLQFVTKQNKGWGLKELEKRTEPTIETPGIPLSMTTKKVDVDVESEDESDCLSDLPASTIGHESEFSTERGNHLFSAELLMDYVEPIMPTEEEKYISHADYLEEKKRKLNLAKPSKKSFPTGKKAHADTLNLVREKIHSLNTLHMYDKCKTKVWVDSLREYEQEEIPCTDAQPWTSEEPLVEFSHHNYHDLWEYEALFAVQQAEMDTYYGACFEYAFNMQAPCATKNSLRDEYGKSNLKPDDKVLKEIATYDDPSLRAIFESNQIAFTPLPPPGSREKLVRMHLELKPEFKNDKVRVPPYRLSVEDCDEIDRQVSELIEAGLAEEYTGSDYPAYCSPAFLVDKPGSTAKRMVVGYQKINPKLKQHSGSIPFMESTIERAASVRFKSKLDLRSGFWQVDLTEQAKDLLAFVTPRGRIFKWNVMPFGVHSAPALFQELMSKVLAEVRLQPEVKELFSKGELVAEVHIDDVLLGANTRKEHDLLVDTFLKVVNKHHLRVKWEKCEWAKEEIEYLGFLIGYGWWAPLPSKLAPLRDFTIDTSTRAKAVDDIRSFIGSVNFYRRHIDNFTYDASPLTDLIKKETPFVWGDAQQEAFEALKEKLMKTRLLGVPRPYGEMVAITDSSNVGGGERFINGSY